jgi:hypothetical protein
LHLSKRPGRTLLMYIISVETTASEECAKPAKTRPFTETLEDTAPNQD